MRRCTGEMGGQSSRFEQGPPADAPDINDLYPPIAPPPPYSPELAPSSLRVMTLEEAADRLVQAEEAAREASEENRQLSAQVATQAAQMQTLQAKVDTQEAEIQALKESRAADRAAINASIEQGWSLYGLLTCEQHAALSELLGGKRLTVVYRSSRDGMTYADLLRCVGDKTGLVFIIRTGRYVFGAYISAGLQLPDDPTSYRTYDSDVWWFSLAGHFLTPTKIEIDQDLQWVRVAGREADECRENVWIHSYLRLGYGESCFGQPAADIRSCSQNAYSHISPSEGYMGTVFDDVFHDESYCPQHALLAGEAGSFMADEIVVLH